MKLPSAGDACAFGVFSLENLQAMIAWLAGQRAIGYLSAEVSPDAPNPRGRTGLIRRWARCLGSTHPTLSRIPDLYGRLLAAIVAVHFCCDRVQIVTVVNHADRPRIRSFAPGGRRSCPARAIRKPSEAMLGPWRSLRAENPG